MEQNDINKYGVPEQKKFPLPDASHVRSAIKFFNYVDPEYEKELARAILKRAEEYNVNILEMTIGDENRFKKYLSDELKHFGILGQKWGVRRFENENGTLTPEGKERYRKSIKDHSKTKKYVKDGALIVAGLLLQYGGLQLEKSGLRYDTAITSTGELLHPNKYGGYTNHGKTIVGNLVQLGGATLIALGIADSLNISKKK